MLSLNDFEYLVFKTWGVVDYGVTPYCRKTTPLFQNYDRLKNMFVFTGVRSFVEIRTSSNQDFWFPFDGYVSLYDLWRSTGTNAPIKVLGCVNQFTGGLNMTWDGAKWIPVNSVPFSPNYWQTWYLLEFSFTKILEVN